MILKTFCSQNCLLFLLAFITLAPVSVLADNASDARQAIEANIAAMDTAYENQDAAGYVAHTASDFVLYDKKGKIRIHSKDDSAAKVEHSFVTPAGVVLESVNCKSVIKSFMLDKDGNSATETETSVVKYVLSHLDGTATVVKTNTSRDYWVKSGDEWLEKRVRVISAGLSVNGKKIKSY